MKYKKGVILAISCIIVLSSLLTGCIQQGTGTLVMKITDAPSDLNISEAMVSISSVMVHLGAGGNNTTAGWHTVVNESQTFDLIALQNVTDVLGEQELQAGNYTQIRLNIDNANVTIDGVKHDLMIPSSTVKLVNAFKINGSETTTLILDFDIHDSVHETGNNKYILQPTIRVIEE
ncbi:MAG: DUF4382 domain-containing protein [Candidatus Thermoplasmatota archaeon]